MNNIRVLVQVAAGSLDKNLYDETTLAFQETRRITQPYPYAYGFIPGTRGADGDCIDCYVITTQGLERGAIVECEPIGLLEQKEDSVPDHKVLAQLPGEHIVLGQTVLRELQDIICSVFARYPEIHIEVGPIQSRHAAIEYLEKI